MALPGGEIDIANMALDYIGEDRVSSIRPPRTSTELIVSRHYDANRQSVMRKYVPNFAVTRTALARSGTPQNDYSDKYQLPNDFIRLLSVGGTTVRGIDLDYSMEGRELLYDGGGAASINIRYVRDVTDVNLWDAGFRKLCALELALCLALPITHDPKIVSIIDALLTKELPDVYGVDAQEAPPTVIDRPPILARRRRGGSAGWDNRYIDWS